MAYRTLYFRNDEGNRIGRYFIFDTAAELLTSTLIVGDLAYAVDTKVWYVADSASSFAPVNAGGAPGTVTSVSVTTANGVSGSVATSTSTPAITLTLGAITPTTIVASSTIAGSNLSGTNTGDQTSIVGITGTIAQFNTALSDGDFATGGGTATGTNTGDQTTVSGNAGTVTVGDAGGDTETFPLLGTAATGSLSPATDAGLTYNATTNALTTTTFVGALTGNVTGNVSGTAATVTGAAQAAITSLGTLTALDVDNINLNGNTITGTGDLNLTPTAGNQVVLDGTIEVDAGVVTGATSITSTTFIGALTGNVTGNASGTAATVTGAAQTAITSLGTLTALNVDNININGNTISSTAGTDLNITPLAGQQIVLDGTIVIDAGVVTGATSITSDAFVGALTGNASTATTVTTNANLTGDVTSVGNATTIGAGKVTEAMQVLADNTTNDFSTTKHGYVPKGTNVGSFLKDDGTWAAVPGGGDALTTNPLSQFAATTSLQLKGVISDETGSGALVFADTPTLVTPVLGVASATSLATSAASPLLLTNGQLVTVALTSQTTGGVTLTIPDFADVDDEFTFKTKAQTMSNKTFVAPILGTPTSGTLTNCTFPTLNQNTTGSAASLSVSGQTGLMTVTGLLSTNRIKTVRDAADTILELGGSYTPSGTWTSLTMVTPVLGTPASGNLANCTFPTLNQNTTGTANIAGGTLGAIPYQSGAGATTVLAATATANKILVSGASAAPTWSTPTFPNASATTRKIIVSDGTNWTASTETYAVPGTTGNVLTSDGTNWTSAAPTGSAFNFLLSQVYS